MWFVLELLRQLHSYSQLLSRMVVFVFVVSSHLKVIMRVQHNGYWQSGAVSGIAICKSNEGWFSLFDRRTGLSLCIAWLHQAVQELQRTLSREQQLRTDVGVAPLSVLRLRPCTVRVEQGGNRAMCPRSL